MKESINQTIRLLAETVVTSMPTFLRGSLSEKLFTEMSKANNIEEAYRKVEDQICKRITEALEPGGMLHPDSPSSSGGCNCGKPNRACGSYISMMSQLVLSIDTFEGQKLQGDAQAMGAVYMPPTAGVH